MTGEIVIPGTGELVPLDAPTDELARIMDEIRELERALREAKSEIAREVHERMDVERQYTVEAGPWKVTGQSPESTEYDVGQLIDVLRPLVDSGELPERLFYEAVEYVPKVRKAGINKLLKVPGPVKDAVLSVQQQVPRARRLGVERVR